MRHPRRDHLAATGIAGHEMRLDQTCGDLDIGLDEEAVQTYRAIMFGGSAKMRAGSLIPGIVIDHTNGVEHPGITDQFREFLAQIGPVQPRSPPEP